MSKPSRLGDSIPPNDSHGVSVFLPTWTATLGYCNRDKAVLDQMRTGYPRFFIHRTIVTLAERIADRFGNHTSANCDLLANCPNREVIRLQKKPLAMLFPDGRSASRCKTFLNPHTPDQAASSIQIIALATECLQPVALRGNCSVEWDKAELHAILYPPELFSLAKSFWQHTGFRISSQYALFCLDQLDRLVIQDQGPNFDMSDVQFSSPHGVDHQSGQETRAGGILGTGVSDEDARGCSLILRQGIADLATSQCRVDITDVYLFSSGMRAISNIVETLRGISGFEDSPNMVACGFLYVDTFKVLSKVYGLATTLYGHTSALELDRFESQLIAGFRVCALFCEYPGNPLLQTPDISRLRRLADTYHFLIVCDDTVGTFLNVDVLPFVDVVVTSLTKMFSGACNVMGGSVILNSRGPRYDALQKSLGTPSVDTYFPGDVSVMEANSRDFAERVHHANRNAELVCNVLENHVAVDKVHYPKGSSSQHLYDTCKRPGGGYGYLLSVEFTAPQYAIAFFDALDVAKGPSLGTNFTLACPYTLYGRYRELEWAAQYGVTEHLVRISVGLEPPDLLARKVDAALEAVEDSTPDRHER